MKFSSALLLLTSAVLGVRPSSAQGKPLYYEVGTTLTLEPDVSNVPQPITTIRWKYGTALVVDWDPSGHTYYGSFKGRTTFDPETMRLVINLLTLADSGQFSLETNVGIHVTYEVEVIKPPPTPSIMTQPLLCEFTCALKCAADTTDLGPVSYEWKKDEGEWNKGDALKNISSSDTPEKFSCRLKTRVRTSEASIPKDNPLYKPPEPKYFEVGTTLTLEPDVSTVEKPIYSIRWKCGTALVVDWDLSGHTYYGSFRGRTTLDPQTLRFDINRLTLADSGQFSLETNLGIVGTYEVKVIKPPPTPSIMTQPLLCEFTCALKCAADTTDLGPVSYEWKKDEGEWNKGDALKNISSSDTPEKFSCRLKTRVRTSEASIPKDNPLYKPPEPKYFEVGTTLTLEPDVSTVEKPIYSIRWKCGTALVVDWDLSGHTYYGSFRGRTTLDPQTLRFDINRLTLADSGQFSLETNLGIVGTYEVKVIKPPPTPSIMTQPLLCEFTCALKCAADTTDLGPVSYEWKKDEGEWNKGDALKNISSSDTPEKFSCRLKTRVRTSEASIPKDNPLYKPPGPGDGELGKKK
ncbi:uncharacterized protein LOC130380389 isoform X2 [Gadus chalcogrammus]|uniref:uncharacterized protein LOC130380389 isoform X2 n=1 Tax=Gadus chalcogrammus TaxID=1042646 RepID=UPI0024C2C5F1|nr:uncharacterized protein LOC130380389 isoform X2 [Gadus chalcogrammus]